MSYAPPWGGQPAWSAQPTPVGVPHHTGTPAPGPFSAWASPYTHPGVPAMPPVGTHPGAPMMMTYAQPWGATGAPAPARWAPAVVLERGTVVALLLAVMLVGVLGALLGVGSQQLFAGPSAATSPAIVTVDAAPPTLQVLPPTPRWETEPRLPQLRARPSAVPAQPAAPAPTPQTPFSVESSDVRDPWARD